ncbi:hypothetical protein HPP92_014989 [Vanilla planifolia]|uniref:GMP synthase (glutamine-hydrolyzing) n=1 Tax=Vanilla planifolia TaxID=51239 RepID=A0A835QQM3_VANPL|nr:hypothetical protein HPP92_014989 [Vanilla planifolia]
MGSSILSDLSASGGEKPVLILDYGSQYTHLITRRIRQLSILTVCISGTSPLHAIAALNPRVIILSGGPSSVHADGAPSFPDGFLQYAVENGVPVLGICYGMHLLVQKLGGEVAVGKKHEYGKMDIAVVERATGLYGTEAAGGHQTVWMSHGDEALRLPEGFEVIARSLQGSVAAIENPSKRFYGLQYHPEVTHSPKGMESLRHFLINVCGVPGDWNMEDVLEEQIKSVKSLERERVMSSFQNKLHLPVTCIDASEQFLSKLKGVKDPEKKRKVIGEEFIHVFEAFAPMVEKEVGRRPSFLLQGTLYPDVIESCPPPGSGRTHSHTIKSHHNVGGLPERMNLKLIEPLKLLFKDEVRLLGKILNVPESFLKRHPFPGPGLAVRILGDVTEGNALNILREVDEIFIQAIKDAGLYDSIWQAFCGILPVRTVGVQGDQRTHANAVVLRAITSEDGMTADWYYFDHKFLVDAAVRYATKFGR